MKGTLRVAAQRGGPHASLSDAQGVTATRASTLLDSKSRLGRCGWLCCCGSNFALFWSLSAGVSVQLARVLVCVLHAREGTLDFSPERQTPNSHPKLGWILLLRLRHQ